MPGSAAPPLRTNRFDLEPLAVGHALEMVGVLAAPSLYEFTGGAPPTRSDLQRRYAAQTAGPPDGEERWINWVVRDRGTGALVGFVQATVEGDAAEVAWVTGAASQGRGVATEAVSAMVRWLTVQGVGTVFAHIHPGHAASRSVAARVGMTETDVVVDEETRWVLRPPNPSFGDLPDGPDPSGGSIERMADPPMIRVPLDEAERRFLRAALLDWGGPARPSDALAVALGFTSADRMAAETRQLWEHIEVDCTLSSTDWRRALLAAEVVFVSDVIGSGLDWRSTSGIPDADALSTLRGLQRKLPRWRGSWQFSPDGRGSHPSS